MIVTWIYERKALEEKISKEKKSKYVSSIYKDEMEWTKIHKYAKRICENIKKENVRKFQFRSQYTSFLSFIIFPFIHIVSSHFVSTHLFLYVIHFVVISLYFLISFLNINSYPQLFHLFLIHSNGVLLLLVKKDELHKILYLLYNIRVAFNACLSKETNIII